MSSSRARAGGPRVLVLGRPGSGKGTQCGRLAERLHVPHISTGELFRAAVADDTELGRTVRRSMDAGELVPDDIVVELVRDVLGPEGVATGFVLDGFPRTVAQAERLVALLAPYSLDLAIDLVVPAEVARARLAARLVCGDCGRAIGPAADDAPCGGCGGIVAARTDDEASTVARRLAVYDELTAPLIEWLEARGLLVAVDGLGRPEEVATRIDDVDDARLYSGCSDGGR